MRKRLRLFRKRMLRSPKNAVFCFILLMVILVIYYNIEGTSLSGIREVPPDIEERRNILQEFCKARGFWHGEKYVPVPDAPNAILVHEKYKVMWCNIGKVASASLTWKMATFSGKSVNMTPSLHAEDVLRDHGIRFLSSYSSGEQRKLLREYYKFIFVRHPILRLLSAYKDKFLNGPPYTWLAEMAMEHLRIIRPNATVHEYVKFDEFVWLVTNSSMSTDLHWASFEERCQPCNIYYDFVGKLETFDTDFKRILESQYKLPKLDVIYLDKNTRIHSTNASLNLAKEFLSNLNESQRHSLHKKYDHDVEMFGYNWSGILESH